MLTRPRLLHATLLAACCATLAASAQSMPGMQHHHHQEAPAANEQLGQVTFPTSCAARSQAPIQRGVALLHSFGYTIAQMQFTAIAKDDPTCAIAHWGIAMSQFHELWGQPEPAALKLGAEQMAQARKLAAHATPREQAYIHALSAFYDPADATFQQRADAYQAGMNALHTQFPDDVEGAAFDALAIIAATPPDDTTLNHQHQALAILLPLFAAHPEHPGLAHYIIHTCDTPALAPQALAAAREYAKIAPSSPHALHMPGHIFARLGMWQEDIASNLASAAASKKAEAAGEPGAAHQMHADEFLIYAYLQVGQNEKAHQLTANMQSVGDRMNNMPGMDDMKEDGHYFANEVNAVDAIETHDWKSLAVMQPAPGSPAYQTFHTYWGQGIAAGHLHDAALAASALASFDKALAALKGTPYADMAIAAEIQRNEILGWKAYAEDHADAAIAAMRQAADQQDKLGQNEVDIPAREMLGDLLLLQHQPAAALAEYRTALKLSPNRLNGLRSAATAAEQAGQLEEAATYKKTADQQISASM